MWWAQGCPGSDVEKYIDELRAQGWGEEELALERKEAERLAEPGCILSECSTIAAAFLTSRWDLLPVFGAPPVWLGISAREIESACRLHRIPARERAEAALLIRTMAAAAAPILNDRT